MPERINAGQLMVMVGAAALLVSLFIDWYEPGLTGWEAFEIGDILLAGLAIAALAVALPMKLPGGPTAQRALTEQRSLPWIGFAALVFVCVTLVNDPPAARDRPLELGAWLGLIGALLIAGGGLLSRARISVVISPRPSERRTAGGVPSPAERVESQGPVVSEEGTSETRPLGDEYPDRS
jgi:hypothetical protein